MATKRRATPNKRSGTAKRGGKKTAPKKTTARGKPTPKTTKATKASKATRKTKTTRTARKPTARPKAAPRRQANNAASQAGPTLQPMLTVRNVDQTIRMLEAIGFQTAMKMPGPGGITVHAILTMGDAMVHVDPIDMPGPPPAEFMERMEQIRKGPLGLGVQLYVVVPDVDKAFKAAQAHNTKVVEAPTDKFWGDRTATVIDGDGYMWCFAQHVRDVTPEQMADAMKQMAPPMTA